MIYQPHDYQKHVIQFMLSHGGAGLFLDPGLGKTSVVLGTFNVLRKMGLASDMLVVAPLRVANSVWPREATKWDEFKDLRVNVLHGPEKTRQLHEEHDISVINPEGLGWLLEQRMSWDILVIDESTKFKHTDTKRFKLLKALMNQSKFKRRYILTGTPAPNGLMDLFGQIYILDFGASLGRFITHYRQEFFEQPTFGSFEWRLKNGSEQKINERLKTLVVRLDAEDCIKLEPYIHNEIEVELPPDAMKMYKDMENTFVAHLQEEDSVVAANAAAAGSKCRQIANGGIYDANHEMWTVHEVKLDATEDLVEELNGKPCIIAYEFEHDLRRLQSRFPSAPYLGGGVSAKRQQDIEDAWNGGLLPVLLAQPQSVAHGLNLQGVGAAIIWHSLTWNLEDYEQLIRRVWRQGQTERVGVHHILATGTLDKLIMKTLKQKDRTQKTLLNALRTFASEYKVKEYKEV